MNAEAGFDFNTQAIRMGLGMGKGGGGGDPIANEKDMLEYLFDSAGSGGATMNTMLTGAPNKADIFSTGIFKQFEPPEGVHEKMVNSFASSFSAPGGFLYKMFSSLMKNGNITPQTDGIEALASIEGSYGDGGGGGGSGDTGFVDQGGAMPIGEGAPIEPMIVNVSGRSYEVAGVGESSLGDITPSTGGGSGSSLGNDDIGRA